MNKRKNKIKRSRLLKESSCLKDIIFQISFIIKIYKAPKILILSPYGMV